MYVFNCNNPSIGKWLYLEEYLLVIVWVTLGETVTAVIFWYIIRAFGNNSKHYCMDLTVTDIYNP